MNLPEKEIQELLPEIAALRHDLHRHPEIAFEEQWTSDRIARFLAENGIPHERGYAGGTGIVATVKGPGERVVVLRADIDALPIEEETGLPYASTIPGRMHACGHDGHTAVVCAAAKLLARHRDQLRGTVRFLFQPAEEITGGAARMISEGVLEGAHAVFGLHGWPDLPLGHVGVRNGCFMAGSSVFEIVLRGRGSHGANPGAGIDPIVAAAHLVAALQTVVSREVDPWEPAVVTVGRLEAGTAPNVIPETARLEGTFRTLSSAVQRTVQAAIERITHELSAAFRIEADAHFSEHPCPPVITDPRMTDVAREAVRRTLGADRLIELQHPVMTAEDFAYYLEKTPGTFFFLGVDDRNGAYPGLHHPRYDFNDAALAPAIRVMTELAFSGLKDTGRSP